MFVRVKRSVQESGTYEYLQIVESVRDGARIRQRVIGNLGRRDQLVADGTLEALLQSLAKFSQRLRVVEKVRTEGLQAHQARSWGPALVFERLWQEQELPAILARLTRERRCEFDVERACFALALQRLCAPGSDLHGAAWLPTIECAGLADLELHHLYRTTGVLAGVRSELERELFAQDRDLFTQTLDLVFIDTTSTYLYRPTETPLRRRGYSRDRMPDQPQVVLCLAVDRHGWPIAWDLLPGNTADQPAFRQMIASLRDRFHIRRVIVVADRGMLSRDTVALLTEDATAPFDFILGCRMRQQTDVVETVLARAGRYQIVAENLEVKAVTAAGRRYVICRNPAEAKKDAAARAAILAHLETALQRGPKAVIGNTGFRRFLRVARGAVTIDRAAVARDERLDGKFVLRTNTDLPPDEVARAYKSLWRVERAFRETKATLEVRPIFHHRDDTTLGHIVACFLALRLEVDLQRRLDARGVEVAWPNLMTDLAEVRAVDLTLDGERYRLRTDLRGSAAAAFTAAGVRPPRIVTHLGPAQPAAAM
ncbi:MAG TPA: IS1634 family transposase [Candidatus Baltobacteraceae bacterium]|nr:IS1634 family transposase [Candidatus Baltobacteraceae bacterium]